jgi:hypothetical protein
MRSSNASLPSVCRLHSIFKLPVVPPDRIFIGGALRDDCDHTRLEYAVVSAMFWLVVFSEIRTPT